MSSAVFSFPKPRFAAPLIAAAALAACTPGAPYREPAAPAEAPFDAATDAPVTGGEPPRHWWRLYQDSALDALIRDALAQNRELAVAAARVERERALLDEAGAARLPATALALGVDYGKHEPDQLVAAARGGAAKTRAAFAPSLSVAWEVDLWGRVRHRVEAARADAQSARATEDALRVAVAADTTGAYVLACALGERIGFAERSLALAERIATLTERQRDYGLVSALEVARARAFAEEAGAELPALRGQRQAALYALAVLTGRAPADVPAAAARCGATPLLAQPFPVGDGATLLRRRPDLRALERRIAAAHARADAADADLYPSIELGAAAAWLSTTSAASSLGDAYAGSWGVGPLIRWHFPNLAASRARLAQARAEDRSARAAFDAQVLRALQESEQALTLYAAAWRQRERLAAARAQHQRAFALAEQNYRAGALDFLDLLDAERSLVAVDAALAASTQRVALDQVTVFKTLGGGWQP